ncbi:hypothetical protein BDQ12DRAFT_442568 [Crucibulum laeve]|uniref:Uncharacterized protein n=1 Tax=Crucibulum laeve TaxID=68775 RepID=A0A5C3LKG8_9AGAR|nr:hypothetical protein BDQ12DRAFT_442568 [Crucibulum laeve]
MPTHKVFYDQYNDYIYSSPNVANMPEHVPLFLDYRKPKAKVEQDCTVDWYSPAYPYLAFLPSNANFRGCLFTGPIFKRLDVGPDNIPLVTDRMGRWKMHDDAMASWMRLEVALTELLKFLIRRSKDKRRLFGYWMFTNSPIEGGYRNVHDSERKARGSVIYSRNNFVHLMSYLSFLIAFNSESDELSLDAYPAWMLELNEKMPAYKFDWLSDLRQSFVGTFTFGTRVGAIFDGVKHDDGARYEIFIRAGIPMWYAWGRPSTGVKPDLVVEALRSFIPTKDNVDRAVEAAQRASNPAMSALPLEQSRPPVYQGSGQRQGQTIGEFIQNMAKVEDDELSKMGPEEKASALERMGRPRDIFFEGSFVFEWVRIGTFALRKPVLSRVAARVWASYRPTQRKYHAIVDEWDLSISFDPSSTPFKSPHFIPISTTVFNDTTTEVMAFLPSNNNYESDDDDDDYGEDIPSPQSATSASLLQSSDVPPSQTSHLISQEMTVRTNTSTAVTSNDVNITLDNFMILLKTRFGFYASTSTAPVLQGTPSNLDFGRILTRFAVPATTSVDEALQPSIRQLFYMLTSPGEPKIRAIGWDLNPRHPNAFKYQSAPLFTRKWLTFPTPLFLLGHAEEGSIYKQWWIFAFESAATVLQVYRGAWSNTMAGTARELLQRGIPFHTVRCIQGHRKPPSLPIYSKSGLGVRSKEHAITIADYVAYEQRRDELLQGPAGRAALMRGGLLWRLARGIVSDKAVTKGPSKGVHLHGNVHYVISRTEGQDDYLIDDGLHKTAEYILVGMYCVPTGKPRSSARLFTS